MKAIDDINIISDKGIKISGKTIDDIVTAGGTTVTLDPSTEISVNSGVIHFQPKEIQFSSSVYTLTDSSNFIILIYNGPTQTVTVNLTFRPKQTVYIVNTTVGATIALPLNTFEGDKTGAKYYGSELVDSWMYMGQFAFSI